MSENIDPNFQLSAYDFELPEELIAQSPVEPRDSSRLLVIDRLAGTISHRTFSDLPDYLSEQDVLVANNTMVIKARLLGHRILEKDGVETAGGKVEFLMLQEVFPGLWEGAFHASAKYQAGLKFYIPTPDGIGVRGEIVNGAAESSSGTVTATFDRDPILFDAGEVPLPPYITRKADSADETRYQTVYAKRGGSAAAPTAGLHFTETIMQQLTAKKVGWEEVTLHVGLGTFRPVKTDDIRTHVMHKEWFELPAPVAQRISEAKRAGRRICAVGTTAVRTLETTWDPAQKRFMAKLGKTGIFIHPGGRPFQAVDRLITNFHLPKSTLLMLVCAFAGRELVLKAYREAVERKYRFFSYGDAMLII